MARNIPNPPEAQPSTTGHEWDGIQELDNPLPRWWLWIFYACIAWSVLYWIAMPTWPIGGPAERGDYTKGLLGYSQRASLERSLSAARQRQQAFVDKIRALPLTAIAADRDLAAFAVAGGRSAFSVNCSQCHGTGAAGSVGYPNLNDDDWLWGGKLGDIHKTISFGIRSDHDETHESQMPAFLKDEVLTKTQIEDLAALVLSLSGTETEPAILTRARPLYQENCASCHRDDGKGNRELGAPDLTDKIWLYGGDRQSITRMISDSRAGVMPAWTGRLPPETLKMLAIFVHSLGGGER